MMRFRTVDSNEPPGVEVVRETDFSSPDGALDALRRERALREVTQALAQHLDEARVLDLTVQHATSLMAARYARVWLVDGDSAFRCAAAHGFVHAHTMERRLPLDSVSGVAARGKLLNLLDAPSHPAWHVSRDFGERTGMRAYLGAAIRRAGESLGVLEVMRQRELPFGDADEQLLGSLADVVAVAVSNARQAGSLREVQLRLSMLAEASAILATSFDYEATLRQVAVLAVPTLADWCTISLFNDNGTIRQLGSAHGHSHGQELGSQLRVPLVARGRTLGALTLVRSRSNRAYDKDDLALAEDLARRCATAIDNARLYQQAQEALSARDQFLAIAAHELRGPLARLKSHAEVLVDLLSDGHVDLALERQSLQRMNAAVDRLTTLTTDLLDVSRLRRRMPLRRQSIELGSLVRGVLAEHSSALAEHRVVLELASEQCRLQADPDRLGQVISNLLENAAKYSPPGGSVRVSLEVTRAEAVLRVTDQGIGLPPGAAERIFEPFSRAANVLAGNIPGLGLGLHICRQIVLRHGGRIWAESPGEGLGTTVHVGLPRRAARARGTSRAPRRA